MEPDTETFQPNLKNLSRCSAKRQKQSSSIHRTIRPELSILEATIQKMAAILETKQKEFGTSIYLISDEPYRELAYDGVEVPYLTKYYRNTIVGYSFSKSLSLPGERIGYLVMPDELDGAKILSQQQPLQTVSSDMSMLRLCSSV